MTDADCLVVMATYNGERWITAQLDSLQSQEHSRWQLLVSDDGSTDATVARVRERAAADERIVLLPPRDGPPGHVANFEYLLQQAAARDCAAIFLADQDDCWLPGKLACQLDDLTAGSLAACSDLVLIDEQGREQGTFWQRMGLNPAIRLHDHLAQNAVVGCSLALRPELLALALPFPPQLQNHDWWLALCALASGAFRASPQALLQYRQHGGNTIGVDDRRGQWRRRGDIIRRQRRVIDSKIIAVDVLVNRLEGVGQEVPEELRLFLRAFAGSGRLAQARALAGPFRPQSRSLLLVQLLSLLR